MKLKMIRSQKGVTLVALIITIIVMLILAGASTVATINIVQKAESQQVISNMLLIQTKVKIIMEQVAFDNNTERYVGIKLKDQANKSAIAGAALTSSELDEDKYYIYNQATLNSIGLESIKDNKTYIVNYENGDIIFPKGIVNLRGNVIYKLSDAVK